MLPAAIVQIWKEQIFADKNIDSFPISELEKNKSIFQRLTSISTDKAREELSNMNSEYNRDLAWFVLEGAIKKQAVKDLQYLVRLVQWAAFIAEFGDPLKHRKDALEAHCEFYLGILHHIVESQEKARVSYLKAETYYRDASSNRLYLGLVIYAQGYLSLELQNIGGDGKSIGARDKFKNALEIVNDRSINVNIFNNIKSSIDRGLEQFDLVDSLLKKNNADTLLSEHNDLIDPQLCIILKGRMYSLAFNENPVSDAYKAAVLLDRLSNLLGGPANNLDTLKAIYKESSNTLSQAEWIVREQLKNSSIVLSSYSRLELDKELAGLLILQSKYSEAKQLFEKILENDPHDVFARNRLGDTLMSLGEYASASNHYRNVLAEQPNEKHANQMLKQIASETITWAGSHIDDNRRMILHQEDCDKYGYDVVVQVAFCMKYPETIERSLDELSNRDKDLFEKVRSLLTAMGLISPSLKPAQEHFYKAEEFFKQAHFQEAIKEYNLAIDADPNYANAYLCLGDCYFRMGEYNMAIGYFEESLKIQPSKFAYRFLGDAYKHLSKYEKAIELYKQALEIDPNYSGAAESLEDLLNKAG